ncbi:MAG: metallophosphoesterase [Armatimonadetes bacterium]|nr:metallophosphoesterase [Armatimonadota bacterium]
MTRSGAAAPISTRRQVVVYLLLALWVEAGCVVALKLFTDLSWSTALWQAAICAVASGPFLVAVIAILSVPKKLARISRRAYIATWPFMSLAQYGLPWLGWSALVWWLSGGEVSRLEALHSGAAIAIFCYVNGFAAMLRLRPRAGDVEVTRTDVYLERLPPAFDGYRVLHISDIHGGSSLYRTSVRERLAAADGIAADLVVFTGDLASHSDAIEDAASALGELQARDGIVAVLGNHDYWMGEEKVSGALAAVGVRVLRNEHMVVERGGERLYVVGVEDCCYVGRDDLPGALSGVPEGAPVVVATHSPDIVLKPLAARASAILSGHTHGGQVVFPWIGPLYVPTKLGRRRMSGLLSVGGTVLYVNRGLGEISPPMRLNCPPEIAVLTLRSKPDSV